MKTKVAVAFALTLSPVFSAQAAVNETLEMQYAELKAFAQRRSIEVQKQGTASFKLILPDNIPGIPGYTNTKENGRNVVYITNSQSFKACAQGMIGSATATTTAGAVGRGATGIKLTDPSSFRTGTLTGAIAGGFASLVTGGTNAMRCTAEGREKLMQAVYQLPRNAGQGITVKAGAYEKKITGAPGEMADINANLIEMEKRITENLTKEIRDAIDKKFKNNKDKKLEDIVSAEMKKIKEKTSSYFAAMKDAQEAQKKEDDYKEKLARAQQLHDDIQLTAQGLTAFVGIAFSDNPKLANNINRGISGAAQLAQIGVALSVATGPFGAVMLGLSAMGVMNSMFGDSEESAYTKIFMENISALKDDIKNLRTEMHERFDEIQRSLATLATYMEKRFDTLDGKLTAVQTELRAIHEEKDITDRLIASSISYTLTYPATFSIQNCLKGNSAFALDYAQYSNCLGNFTVHANKVARLDLISGGGRVANDYLGPTGTKLHLSIDQRQSLGYLTALDEKIRNTEPAEAPPSPLEWRLAVEAYLTLIDRYDQLPKVKSEVTKKTLIQREKKDNLLPMIAAGQQIKTTAAMLREDGAIIALGRYGVEMKELIETVNTMFFEELSKEPLNLTKITEVRNNGQYQIHASKFMPCVDLYKFMAGSDPVIASDSDRVHFRSGKHCNVGGAIETTSSNDIYEKEKAYNVIKNNPESAFSMQDHIPETQAKQTLHKLYLERQQTGKFTADVQKAIPIALEKVMNSKEVVEKLQRVEYLQHLLMQYVLVGLDNAADPVTQKNVKLIQSMVTKPAQVKALFARIDYKSEQPLKLRFTAEAGRLIHAEEARVKASLESNPSNDSFPFIDKTLMKLRGLSASVH